jgi:hypothetical protein
MAGSVFQAASIENSDHESGNFAEIVALARQPGRGLRPWSGRQEIGE